MPVLRTIKSLRSVVIVVGVIVIIAAIVGGYFLNKQNEQIRQSRNESSVLKEKLASTSASLSDLLNQDQVKINKALEEEIANIQKTYKKTVATYENLVKLKEIAKDTKTFDAQFVKSLTLLSDRNYASADAELSDLNKKIQTENTKITSSFVIPANVPEKNTPPASGYGRQQVTADTGTYLVDVVSADLGSTKVIVDTASDSDCANACPVLSLGEYVARSGGFAGINGSYFCPEAYPSCAGKTNSFDTLLMNKNKHYFNSDNNKFSTVPAVIFLSGSVRFVGQSLQWGRDTGVDGVLANQPLLLSGGNIVFGGDGDPKKGSVGSRSFVGNKGNTIYIGVVHNATVAEVAHVLKTMGLENALNLDSGGSTALWSGGYKVGPGRNIPNAIVFVRK